MTSIKENILNNEKIYIFSGEGEEGMREEYTGKRTLRALKIKLTKEKCKGDRWARAQFYDENYGWFTFLE